MTPIAGGFLGICRKRHGAIAQLGERVVRNDEVGGSIPPGSTTLRPFGLRVTWPVWKTGTIRLCFESPAVRSDSRDADA